MIILLIQLIHVTHIITSCIVREAFDAVYSRFSVSFTLTTIKNFKNNTPCNVLIIIATQCRKAIFPSIPMMIFFKISIIKNDFFLDDPY